LNLKYNKDIKNNVFICDVIFDSYGTPLLTPEVEKSYVESFVPTIQYKDLSFKRYFNVVNNNVVEDKGTVNYINTLSINIPTSVIANPVTAGSANITIGTKTISIAIANTTTGVATSSEIENGVINAVKSDTSILALYSASDVGISNGKIVASKTVTTDPSTLVQAINTVWGSNSVTTSNLTTYTGALVQLTLNNRLVPIDNTLSISFSIDKNTIQDSAVNNILSTKELVCEAMVLCYQLTIDNAVKSALADMRSKVNNFEGQTIETL
jgi:hypothetical protein